LLPKIGDLGSQWCCEGPHGASRRSANGINWSWLAWIREESEMSPTYYAVQMARLNREIETARLAGDLPRLQKLAGEQTLLMQRMYGRPA
jgi:hypothetical protein